MFRQSGSDPPGELLVTGGGSGPGSDVNLADVGGAAIALGQAAMAASLPVVIASDQSPLPISITSADVNLIEVGGAAIALGQGAMAASVPVVLASNQSAVPISAASLPLPTGAATAALQTQPGVDIGDVTVNNGAGAAAVNIQDGGNAITVDGTVAVTQATATNLKAQAEAYQGGTAVGAANPLQVSLANTGANATAVKVDGSAATQPVSGTVTTTQGTSPWIVAGGGTAGTAATGVVTVQGIASGTPVIVSQATASSLNAQAVGNIAHDGADSGNPIKVGNKAISYGTNPTGVAANDRSDAYANVAGIPFVLGGHPNVITRRDNYTSAQTDTAIVTVAGGTKLVLLSCTVAADAANSVSPAVRVGFGATNTPSAAGTYLSHPGVPAGGGIREAGMVAGADGEDIRITCAVPTGGSLDVVTKYFSIES